MVFRGEVIATTENTVTIRIEDSVENTFNFEKVKKLDKSILVEGAKIKVVADMSKAKPGDTIYKAIKIELDKNA